MILPFLLKEYNAEVSHVHLFSLTLEREKNGDACAVIVIVDSLWFLDSSSSIYRKALKKQNKDV
jgi:hypothetical protein